MAVRFPLLFGCSGLDLEDGNPKWAPARSYPAGGCQRQEARGARAKLSRDRGSVRPAAR